jgi:hypothetical protein
VDKFAVLVLKYKGFFGNEYVADEIRAQPTDVF